MHRANEEGSEATLRRGKNITSGIQPHYRRFSKYQPGHGESLRHSLNKLWQILGTWNVFIPCNGQGSAYSSTLSSGRSLPCLSGEILVAQKYWVGAYDAKPLGANRQSPIFNLRWWILSARGFCGN